MKRAGVLFVLCFCGLLSGVQAQQGVKWRGSNFWGIAGKYDMLYDKYNIQTYVGKIAKIDTISPSREMSYGVFMVIKDNNNEYTVHLGPAWYMMYQDVVFGVGSEVEVKGCRVTFEGREFIMAAEVNFKDKVLLLRDKEGLPSWCAFRKKTGVR
jgi:hypothetical protein